MARKETRHIGLNIDVDLLGRLDKFCAQELRTRANGVEVLIRRALARENPGRTAE